MAAGVRGLTRLGTVIATAAAGVALVAGCGQTKVSSASLHSRLAPTSVAPGFSLERIFDWSDPVNLVGEGIHLPERTHPSQAVSEIRSAGFQGAAGEQLNQGAGVNQTVITTGVMKFNSASGARKIRDWMHSEDLQEPCFSQCIFSTFNLPVPGVPTAVGARQVASAPPGPPPGVQAAIRAARRRGVVIPGPGQAGSGPPTNYFAEFTIGPYLYFATMQASSTPRFLAGVTRYYGDVSKIHTS